MANQNKLKAYVRYDGTGRVISGSLILQRFKPAVGNWVEIDANECCNSIPTTTTTTTQGGGSSVTAWVANAADRNFEAFWRACNNPDATIMLYTNVDAVPLPPNTPLYTDASLTTLISTTYPDYAVVSINGFAYNVVNGYTNPLGVGTPCSSITTTTTTTAFPSVSQWTIKFFSSEQDGCLNSFTTFATGYTASPFIQPGTQVWANPELTMPFNPQGYSLVGFVGDNTVYNIGVFSVTVITGIVSCP